MLVLKQLRRKKRINQTDLAVVIGVSLRTIQLYEKKNANIPIKNLTKIAEYFEVSIAELYSNEVNEQEGIYYTSNTNSKKGQRLSNSLGSSKYIISTPLVLVSSQAEYFEHQDNFDFLNELVHVSYVVEMIEEVNYVSFEIEGNSMFDGSIQSIPSQSIVLGKEISLKNKQGFLDFKNKVVILIYRNSILCKKVVDYNERSKLITCHSLNSSPEYADFEVPLSEVKRLFEVVRKQIG